MEFAGVVAATPSASSGGRHAYRVGDRVFGAAQGAYAEVIAVPEGGLRRVPEGWSFQDAAGLMVTAPTSYAALVFRAQVQKGKGVYIRPTTPRDLTNPFPPLPGEYVLIHASAGGVGLAAIQVAKSLGATVIATASTPAKLRIARLYGADHTLLSTSPTWPASAKALTPSSRGVDVVFDPVGLLNPSLTCVAWNARLLVIGFASGTIEKIAANRLLLKNVSLVGVFWGRFTKEEPETVEKVWKGLFELIEKGSFRPMVWVEREFVGLEKVGEALKALGGRETWGKVVVKVPQGGESKI
jgi:NADPH:quinone reductase